MEKWWKNHDLWWFTCFNWWFRITMWNYQRVTIQNGIEWVCLWIWTNHILVGIFWGKVFTMVLTYEKSMDSPRKNGWNWLDLMGISPIRPLIPGCTWQVRKCLDPMSTTSSCQRLEKKLRHKDGHVAMGF